MKPTSTARSLFSKKLLTAAQATPFMQLEARPWRENPAGEKGESLNEID